MLKKTYTILFFFVIVLSTIASAQDKPVFVNEALGMIGFIEGRVYQLAEEVPADKYS